jgi:hypothetical protein
VRRLAVLLVPLLLATAAPPGDAARWPERAVGAVAAAPGDAVRWSKPVEGAIAAPFAYDARHPFVRGAHRGVDLAARAGERVRAPCPGRVTFAGRVPGHGRAVSIRCGALVATLLDLGATRVGRGVRLAPGTIVGLARGARVHLGARRFGDRFGYREPPLDAPATRTPLGPVPAPARRPSAPAPAPAPARAPAPAPAPGPARAPAAAPAPAPVRATAPEPATVPALAWPALALIAAGLPAGALWRRRSRRRARARAVALRLGRRPA